MLKKFAYLVGGLFRYFKKRYSLEHVFQLLGGFLGFAISLTLLIGGIAAVPFTGGASLVPVWVGWLIFLGVVTTTTLAFGRFFGITMDTILNKHKPNNEKLATAVAFVISMIIAALAAPIAYVAAPFVNTLFYKSIWGITALFFTATTQAITSIGRHIGRTVDKHFDQKTLPDRFKKMVRYVKEKIFGIRNIEPEQIVAEDMTAEVGNKAINATVGITNYLLLPRDGENTHLDFLSRIFDYKAGKRRAIVYLKLLENADCELKKAIVLYTMLGSGHGDRLKSMVSEEMGFRKKLNAEDDEGHVKPVKTAKEYLKKYIHQKVPVKKDREYLMTHVISKLGLYADNSKRLYKATEDEEITEVKNLNRENTPFDAKKIREEYSEVWDSLNNARFRN